MALEGRQPPSRTPTFELVFFLTMEAFGKLHPDHRYFSQWSQMTETERRIQRRDIAETYVQTARRYEHSAIFVHGSRYAAGGSDEETMRLLDDIRELAGNDYFLLMHGDATHGLPSGDRMMEFVESLADRPQEIKDGSNRAVDNGLARAEKFKQHGLLDGYALCSDYCFNTGPFLSPAMFDEFVTPFLARLTAGYRQLGFYVIKHTDGNIMPIIDSLVSCRPHALHSLDPQGGVDIAEIKRRFGKQICLIGNVNCALMDTGTDEQVVESARYALRHGMPGGGYIFSTSNCVYTGMDLGRYDLILDVWRREGNYD
ncbi:MAG: hypothetical protein HZA50_08565 [Planctomycetes bacterium]|nr:hypothetical protein [Planctomycetota bacterium]